MYYLEVEDAEARRSSYPLGTRPLRVGRSAGNDLVLSNSQVSSTHLTIWREREEVWVEDMRTRNGTQINGEPMKGTLRIQPGDVISIGESLQLRVRQFGPPAAVPMPGMFVEDLDLGVSLPLRGERLKLSAQSDADIVIPDAGPEGAMLSVHAGSEVWLGMRGEERELDADEVFVVGGRRFCLRRTVHAAAATVDLVRVRYPYALVAALQRKLGPLVILSHTETGATARFDGDLRAVLLYLLGRRIAEDRKAGLGDDELGWMPDNELAKGLWGGMSGASRARHLNVLVYRVRQTVAESGMDPWFLEKRRRYLRARLDSVEIH